MIVSKKSKLALLIASSIAAAGTAVAQVPAALPTEVQDNLDNGVALLTIVGGATLGIMVLIAVFKWLRGGL